MLTITTYFYNPARKTLNKLPIDIPPTFNINTILRKEQMTQRKHLVY